MKIQEGIITFIPVAYSIYCLNHSENEKLSCNICSGEAGRDHRGAVQRSGQGWDTVPPTCWGVGGSPGGMVNHSGKLLLKITPEERCYLHICVSFLKMTYLNAGGDWLLNHGHHWGNGCVWKNWRCAVHKTIMGQSVSPVLFLGWETRWDKMTVVCTII